MALGLQQGRSQAQLLRRSVRRFNADPVDAGLVEAAVAEALTAPAPHHTRPVRFVWMQDPRTRLRLLDRMKDRWRADLTGDGKAHDHFMPWPGVATRNRAPPLVTVARHALVTQGLASQEG